MRRLLPLCVLLLHAGTLIVALWQRSYLWEDSVQYLTLAENLQTHGVYSQDYLPLLTADTQRPPAYALLLIALGRLPWLILLVQHLLVLHTAWLLYGVLRRSHRGVARLAGWGYALMPYPALFASTLLTESLFIWCIVASWHLLASRRWGLSGLALGLALLTKELAWVLLPLWLGYLLAQRAKAPAYLELLGAVLVLYAPWYLYCARQPETGGINLVYGKLGGMLGPYTDDRALVFRTDSTLVAAGIPLQKIRQYGQQASQPQTRIAETARHYAWQYGLTHPLGVVRFHLRSMYQMATGIGYGTALRLLEWPPAAWLLAGLQACLSLLLALGSLGFLYWNLRRWPRYGPAQPGRAAASHAWLGLLAALVLLLAHAAAWADGRYRMPADAMAMAAAAAGLGKLTGANKTTPVSKDVEADA